MAPHVLLATPELVRKRKVPFVHLRLIRILQTYGKCSIHLLITKSTILTLWDKYVIGGATCNVEVSD